MEIIYYFFNDFTHAHKLLRNTVTLAIIYVFLDIVTYFPTPIGDVGSVILSVYSQLWLYFFLIQSLVCFAVYVFIFLNANNNK